MTRVAERGVDLLLSQPNSLGDSDCEALRDGFFSQPVNTVTSMSYAIGGFWLLARARSLRSDRRVGSSAFGALMVANGLGSVAYHGPQFPGSQTLHDAPAIGLSAVAAAVPVVRRLTGRSPLPGAGIPRMAALGVVSTVAAASYIEGRTASRVCDPDSWLQLHGLWHVATAMGMALWATVLWPVESEEIELELETGTGDYSSENGGDG